RGWEPLPVLAIRPRLLLYVAEPDRDPPWSCSVRVRDAWLLTAGTSNTVSRRGRRCAVRARIKEQSPERMVPAAERATQRSDVSPRTFLAIAPLVRVGRVGPRAVRLPASCG